MHRASEQEHDKQALIIGWILDGPRPVFTDVISEVRRWMDDGLEVYEVTRVHGSSGKHLSPLEARSPRRARASL